jgi:hypothetical protein
MSGLLVYSGVAATLEEAIRVAHAKIPAPPPPKDYNNARVVDWGMQYGGFAGQTRYWVRVVEDKYAPFLSDG